VWQQNSELPGISETFYPGEGELFSLLEGQGPFLKTYSAFWDENQNL
jgi:hypothetical protein